MRNSLCFLALCVCILLSGCGKKTEARTQHDKSLRGNAPSRSHGGPAYDMGPDRSSGNSASLVPAASGTGAAGAEELLDSVTVAVEEVEKKWTRSALAEEGEDSEGYLVLAVRVKVHSESARPQLLVQPQRFTLETDEGESMPLRMSGRKQPVLPTTYMAQGDTVAGWLTFEIQPDHSQYILKTDLRRPTISVTVAVPAD